MWSVVYRAIADHTGHSTEEVHAFIKARFLPRTFVRLGNQEEPVEKSTTELTTAEMEEYLTRVRVFASEQLGLFVPQPSEILKITR